ncbi:MAG: hypothetical protein ACLGSA_05280 [Acidobacteriota bacterium]
MAPPGKLNLIWFRDQEPAKRLCIRSGWIRAVTYFMVFVTLCAAGGIFAAYEFWRRGQEMLAERREVEKRLSDTLLKLERLQNIEKLLQTSDSNELSQLLAGMGLETSASKAQASAKPGRDAKDSPKDTKDVPKDAARNGASDRDRPAGFDLASVMGKVDLGQVGVENFRARIEPKGLSYGFDLSNQMPQALSGNGQLLAVSREGNLIPVQTGKDDLGFNIQRFKQIAAMAPLPQGVDPGAVFGVRLVLTNASGKTIFSETYPLAQTP